MDVKSNMALLVWVALASLFGAAVGVVGSSYLLGGQSPPSSGADVGAMAEMGQELAAAIEAQGDSVAGALDRNSAAMTDALGALGDELGGNVPDDPTVTPKGPGIAPEPIVTPDPDPKPRGRASGIITDPSGPLSGKKVYIYHDVMGDGVYGPEDSGLTFGTTDSNGAYDITWQYAGNPQSYIIEFDPDESGPQDPLYGQVSCPSTNVDPCEGSHDFTIP